MTSQWSGDQDILIRGAYHGARKELTSSMIVTQPWTNREDDLLRACVNRFGECHWGVISQAVGHHPKDCQTRWQDARSRTVQRTNNQSSSLRSSTLSDETFLRAKMDRERLHGKRRLESLFRRQIPAIVGNTSERHLSGLPFPQKIRSQASTLTTSLQNQRPLSCTAQKGPDGLSNSALIERSRYRPTGKQKSQKELLFRDSKEVLPTYLSRPVLTSSPGPNGTVPSLASPGPPSPIQRALPIKRTHIIKQEHSFSPSKVRRINQFPNPLPSNSLVNSSATSDDDSEDSQVFMGLAPEFNVTIIEGNSNFIEPSAAPCSENQEQWKKTKATPPRPAANDDLDMTPTKFLSEADQHSFHLSSPPSICRGLPTHVLHRRLNKISARARLVFSPSKKKPAPTPDRLPILFPAPSIVASSVPSTSGGGVSLATEVAHMSAAASMDTQLANRNSVVLGPLTSNKSDSDPLHFAMRRVIQIASDSKWRRYAVGENLPAIRMARRAKLFLSNRETF